MFTYVGKNKFNIKHEQLALLVGFLYCFCSSIMISLMMVGATVLVTDGNVDIVDTLKYIYLFIAPCFVYLLEREEKVDNA